MMGLGGIGGIGLWEGEGECGGEDDGGDTKEGKGRRALNADCWGRGIECELLEKLH